MYSSTVALFVLSRIASALADPTPGFDVLTSPASGATFAVGSVLPIVWEPGTSTGTVSILLNGGPTPQTLQHLFVIGSAIKSQAGGYNWTITSAVGPLAAYGLNLTLDGGNEYQESNPFHITGGSETSSSSSSSMASGSSSSSSIGSSSTSSSSSAASTSTVTASTSSAATVSTGSSATTSGTAAASMTSSASMTGTTMTSSSNGTASKTSSAKTSSTSSASGSGPTSGANGRPVQFLSASVAVIGACLYAFAL